MSHPQGARIPAARRAAVVAGLAASLVAGVDITRAIRPALLLDFEPSWALPRLVLWLILAAGVAVAGGTAAGAMLLWGRRRSSADPPPPLPLRRSSLLLLSAAAVVVGALARLLALDRVPLPLWIDDLSLIPAALALEGNLRDFADAIRPAPFGMSRSFGTVGVLYLEVFRLALRAFGTSVFGIRVFPALAGVVSIATAGLLGRALLPRGGGALTAIALAGLRWHLILSRWGWVAVVLIPVIDGAALLILRARKTARPGWALAAGAVAGLGAHVYLSAWVASLGLGLLCLWPASAGPLARPARLRLGMLFAAGVLATASPLFLLREGRVTPYFARTEDHNVFKEMRYKKSRLVPMAAAADFLKAPWLAPDPTERHDIPGRSRLGWLIGVPFAVGVASCLRSPRREVSGYFLTQAGAALLATVAGGEARNPNGFRFAYLATPVAVGIAAGSLRLVAAVRPDRRRTAALAAVGLLAIAGAGAARDTIAVWGASRATFDGFFGGETLIARAALRWGSYGPVALTGADERTRLTAWAVSRYRLDPDALPPGKGRGADERRFRVVSGSAARLFEDERVVERVRDGWGREHAVVLGRRVDRPQRCWR